MLWKINKTLLHVLDLCVSQTSDIHQNVSQKFTVHSRKTTCWCTSVAVYLTQRHNFEIQNALVPKRSMLIEL